MFAKAYLLWKRQGGGSFGDGSDDGSDGYGGDYGDGDYDDGYDGVSWWWTPAGMAVRYTIVGLLFASVLLFFVGGYYHAQRRLRKGLQPLPYHRWMVQRRGAYNPDARFASYQQPGQTYPMDTYAPPPPAYNHSEAPPPVYQPPEGGSKTMADQNYVQVHPVGGLSEGSAPAPPAPAARH